jgi:hypothetical protein
MDPASLIAQTTAGACSGSVQISTDAFATCISLATAAPAMSAGDTVATWAPAPGLSFGSTYAIKVTTAATDAGGGPLAIEYVSATGSTTAAPSTGCANESDLPAETDYCNLQFPAALSVPASQTSATVYGRVYEAGLTEAAGPPAGVTAELGYGPLDANPEWQPGWTWFATTWNVQVGNDDEFQSAIVAPAVPGAYAFAYRFSLDGTSWTYCDANGAGSNAALSFETTQLGSLTVTP